MKHKQKINNRNESSLRTGEKNVHIQVHRFEIYFIHKLNGIQRERKTTTKTFMHN